MGALGSSMSYCLVFHPNEYVRKEYVSFIVCIHNKNSKYHTNGLYIVQVMKTKPKKKEIKFSFLKLEMHRHVVLEQTK